jgi:hypothetical protein
VDCFAFQRLSLFVKETLPLSRRIQTDVSSVNDYNLLARRFSAFPNTLGSCGTKETANNNCYDFGGRGRGLIV